MKKYISLLIFSFLVFNLVQSQSRDVRQLGYFDKIQSNGSFEVIIKAGTKEKVIIEATEGPIDQIKTEVNDNTLEIEVENGSWWSSNHFKFKDVKIYITFTDLKSIVNSGSGTMTLESPIEGNHVSIISSGSGNLYCEDEITSFGDLRIINSGSSKIKINASVIVDDKTSIINSGSGQLSIAELNADELSITNSGSGGIEISSGRVVSESFILSGSGGIRAENMISKKCNIKKSGSGTIHINVSDELSGSSSGSGNIYVKGSQPRLDFNFSGSGKIKYVN